MRLEVQDNKDRDWAWHGKDDVAAKSGNAGFLVEQQDSKGSQLCQESQHLARGAEVAPIPEGIECFEALPVQNRKLRA
jgi:hypothetical protein